MVATTNINDALSRLSSNENRIDIFVNDPQATGYYQTNEAIPRNVSSIPYLITDWQQRYWATTAKGNWLTATAYAIRDLVIQSGIVYQCMIAHTSGTFATDLAANKWVIYQGMTRDELAASNGSSLLGFLQSGTGAVSRTLQSKLREYVSIVDFGADPTGVADSVAAIQLAIAYASTNSKSVFIPDGTFLLDAITFVDPTGLYAQRGQNVFGLLFAKSNVTIFGNGKNSVLKVAANQLTKSFTYTADVNSGTYQNWNMPGTKGFQVFAQHPVTDAGGINNFYLRDFTIDMNGLNNKVYAVNSFSNQSTCHAVYLSSGDNFQMSGIRIKDASGSQVIALLPSRTNDVVDNNEFINCGNLDGTNTNLADHSTIYIAGTNWHVSNNKLIQSVQWTQAGGCPIEMHGTGVCRDNKVSKYLSMGNIAATTQNCDVVASGNIGKSITAMGYDLYCQNSYNFTARINGSNDIELTYNALDPSHASYTIRSFINSTYFDYSPGTGNVEIDGNHVKMVGTPAWTDAEDQHNAIFNLRLIDTIKIRGNTFTGFRGPAIRLREQKTGGGVFYHDNEMISCGRKHNFVTENSLVNYTNAYNNSYGNQLYTLSIKNNDYISCAYASYLSLTGVAAGLLVAPVYVTVDADTSDMWFSTVIASASPDLQNAQTNYKWSFKYSCSQVLDSTALLKVLPQSGTEKWNKAQTGVISLSVGTWLLPMSFTKMYDMTDWKADSIKFGSSAPTASEVSPFGPRVGDVLRIVTATAGTISHYYCVTAGVSGAAGTWKSYGTLAA